MNTRHGLITIVAAAAMAAALAGCNPAADANRFATATATTAPSATSATPAPTTTTSIDAGAQETKDRQDAELAWRRFLGVLLRVGTLTVGLSTAGPRRPPQGVCFAGAAAGGWR